MLYTDETASYCNPWIEKGFHELDFETYVAMDAANAHGLMDILRSPKFYQWKKKKPVEKDEFSFGKLVHWLILEPGFIEEKVKLKKKVDGRTTEGKAYNEEFKKSVKPTDFVMDEEQYDNALYLRDQFRAHPRTKDLPGKCVTEQTAFWVYEEFGVFCKSRLDIITFNDWILDVKTTKNASERSFTNEIFYLNYDLQAHFYEEAYKFHYKKRPKGYAFIAVENNGPMDMAIYTLDQNARDNGKWKAGRALMDYAECYKSGVWRGYPVDAKEITTPEWVLRKQMEG